MRRVYKKIRFDGLFFEKCEVCCLLVGLELLEMLCKRKAGCAIGSVSWRVRWREKELGECFVGENCCRARKTGVEIRRNALRLLLFWGGDGVKTGALYGIAVMTITKSLTKIKGARKGE